jgi:hypothetical protein
MRANPSPGPGTSQLAFPREALVRLVRAPDAVFELAIALGQLHRHNVRSMRRPDSSVAMKVTQRVANFEFVGHC